MMTSKERVLASIRHEEPDRVPMGEWQFGAETINALLGRKTIFFAGLEKALALWNGERDRVIEEWKTALVELVRTVGWDTVLVHNVIGTDTPIEKPESIGDHRWRFSNGDVLGYSAETDRLMIVEQENKSADGAARGKSAPPSATEPKPESMDPTDSEMEVVRHVVRELGKTHFIFSLPLIGHPRLGFGNVAVSEVETWVRLYEDPEGFAENLQARLKHPNVRRGIENVRREGLDGVAFCWDFGCGTGPFMSPDLFRQVILPYLAGMADLIHAAGLPMLMHSCGDNRKLMDMIVEAGVDVYQSIQTEMDICTLKKRYGDRITLWGGVPAGDLVTRTPEEVYQTSRTVLETCKPGGGYVFASTHSLMPGTRIENYRAMLKAHADFG